MSLHCTEHPCLSPCSIPTSLTSARHSATQSRNRKHAKSRNIVDSAPGAFVIISCQLLCSYNKFISVAHTRTFIPGWPIPERNLLPEKRQKSFRIQPSARQRHRWSQQIPQRNSSHWPHFMYPAANTHGIHHERKGWRGNMKQEQLSVITIKRRHRPAWALCTPTQSQQSFRGLIRLEAPIVLLMAVYFKKGFSCKHTEMTICCSMLQCCLGLLLKQNKQTNKKNHIPTDSFTKRNN